MALPTATPGKSCTSIDGLRFGFGLRLPSAILEVTDELLLLRRLDGNHAHAALDASLSLGVDVLELGAMVRVPGAFDGFVANRQTRRACHRDHTAVAPCISVGTCPEPPGSLVQRRLQQATLLSNQLLRVHRRT
jgi:hypothetical protein